MCVCVCVHVRCGPAFNLAMYSWKACVGFVGLGPNPLQQQPAMTVFELTSISVVPPPSQYKPHQRKCAASRQIEGRRRHVCVNGHLELYLYAGRDLSSMDRRG